MASNKRQKSEEEVVLVYKEGVKVPKNVTKIIFDASVTEIPNGSNRQGVFSHCKRLMDVVLNEGLQKIGDWAFAGCESLPVIKLPSAVTEIGVGAFDSCTNLNEVILNEGLQKIGWYAFNGCTSLPVIKLPSAVTEIGAGAFESCTNLKEVILNEGLQKIGKWAFRYCTSLTIIKFPSTVTEVGERAFGGCTNLREVILNEGLQKIKNCAFWECKSLTIIKLPSTVTEVRHFAFYECTNLSEVILNEGLQEIRTNAFSGCASLAVFKIPSISKRAKNLIEAGQTIDIEGKLSGYQHFEWRGGELLASPQAIRYGNWVAVRTHLEQVLAWISHYELKEATTLFELALWKARISEVGAVTDEERSACRVDVPGPAKDTILQYLQQTSDDYNDDGST